MLTKYDVDTPQAVVDIDILDLNIKRMNDEGKKQLCERLQQFQIEYIPSATNFVLIKLGKQAETISQELMKLGVITRYMDKWGLKNHIRITIGTKEENTRMLNALRDCLAQKAIETR